MQTTTTWGALTDDARLVIEALAQLIETALAVDGDAWITAIDDARTHRPIDRACDALARLLGESPALWQEGLGYYPQRGARGLLARAYERCRIETDAGPTFERRDRSPGRPLPEALTPATLPIERIAWGRECPKCRNANASRHARCWNCGEPLAPSFTPTMRGPVVQLVKGDPVNAELAPELAPTAEPEPQPVPAPVHVAAPSAAPSDDDKPW